MSYFIREKIDNEKGKVVPHIYYHINYKTSFESVMISNGRKV